MAGGFEYFEASQEFTVFKGICGWWESAHDWVSKLPASPNRAGWLATGYLPPNPVDQVIERAQSCVETLATIHFSSANVEVWHGVLATLSSTVWLCSCFYAVEALHCDYLILRQDSSPFPFCLCLGLGLWEAISP